MPDAEGWLFIGSAVAFGVFVFAVIGLLVYGTESLVRRWRKR